MKHLALLFVCLFVSPTIARAQQAITWHQGGAPVAIAAAHGSYTPSPQEDLALGDEAETYLRQATHHEAMPVDALVVTFAPGARTPNQLLFLKQHDIGFLTLDQAKDLIAPDAIEKMRSLMKDSSNPQNTVIDGWAEEPSFDRSQARLYWAIRLHLNNGAFIIFAHAVQLGRLGYTDFEWRGPVSQFFSARQNLAPYLTRFHYDAGMRYQDYVAGSDKAATKKHAPMAGTEAARPGGFTFDDIFLLGPLALKAAVVVAVLLSTLFRKSFGRFYKGSRRRNAFGDMPAAPRSRIPDGYQLERHRINNPDA